MTHLSHSTLAGLPGIILTSADVMATAAVSNAKQAAEAKNSSTAPKNPKAPKRPISPDDSKPGLDIIGPKGIDSFIHSLRHFMRREAFEIRVHVGEHSQREQVNTSNKLKRRKTSKNDTSSNEDFYVQSIVCDGASHQTTLSYLFVTPPVQGKFLIEKAKEIGIPPGPLYGQLKAGKAVTFVHPLSGVEQTVESSEVVEQGLPGLAVAILYYSDLMTLEQLQQSTSLREHLPKNAQPEVDKPTLELMVHMTTRENFDSLQCVAWRESFGDDVEHIFLDTDMPASAKDDPGTPFHSSSAGASCRSKLAPDIFVAPSMPVIENTELGSKVTKAVPLLEYTLIPRSKKGFHGHGKNAEHQSEVEKVMIDVFEASGAVEVSNQLAGPRIEDESGEIIFTGTGSAIPCKYRNVSGIYMQMCNGNAILLDAGEGTVGQLFRAKHGKCPKEILRSIRAVWISHPHADHHLGILRLFAERKELLHGQVDPIMIIAPTNLKDFLEEYKLVDPHILDSYVFMDCQDISTGRQTVRISPERHCQNVATHDRLRRELGITSIVAIPVRHCAHSYAVELRGTPFGTLAFSGDCRPSRNFAEVCLNADILIHEATFADGMEAEAAVKRHSTVGEALHVASMMKAKSVVLTHFSQRFPKIPPLPKNDDSASISQIPIVFAFDYMKLTHQNLVAASNITPALRLLYPEDTTTEEDEEIQDALGTPGLFAQAALL